MTHKERFGTEVWKAIVSLSYDGNVNKMPLLSVGEIADKAKVSRATAKKYLMDLVRCEMVSTFPVGKRWVYQYTAYNNASYQE